MKSEKRKTCLKNPEKEIEKAKKKSGNLYFYEISRFLKVLTTSLSICNIALFF
jgi:hypothetical protein